MTHKIESELQLTQPLTSLARELVLNVYRTDQFLTARLEAALRPGDLRIDEFNVLRIIRGGGVEGHPRAEIEKRMVHSPERLLAIVHKLKTRGLIQGTLKLAITAAGRELLASVDPAFDAATEESVAWIGADRIRAVIEVLESIRGGPYAG
jgi:DNA-binding MarR family transcriptional regulator